MIINREVKANQIWEHYKGKRYLVLDIGYDATKNNPINEPIVIYRSLYHCDEFGMQALWSRPLVDFLQKENNGKYKFTLVE